MRITNRNQFDEMLDAIRASSIIAVDTEGTGLNLWGGDTAVGISVYTSSNDETYYYPFAHGYTSDSSSPFEDMLGQSKATKAYKLAMQEALYYSTPYHTEVTRQNMPTGWLDELKAVWCVPAMHVYHNAQFDLTALAHIGFPTPARVIDTRVLAHIIFQGWNDETFRMPDSSYEQGNKGLKWLARFFGLADATIGEADLNNAIDELNAVIADKHREAQQRDEAALKQARKTIQALKKDGAYTADEAKAVRRSATVKYKAYHTKITDSAKLGSKSHMWMLKPEHVSRYAELDTRLTYGLFEKMLLIIAAWDNVMITTTINDIQLHAAWRMHTTGFKLDKEAALDMRDYGRLEMERLQAEADALTGEPLNMNSPSQIMDYMERHGYSLPNTSSATLEAYADDVPLLGIISRYKALSKYIGTYVDAWIAASEYDNGVIHPEFDVVGTKTGRWSSSSKYVNNLQNIPRGTAGSVNPKALLRPIHDDWILIELDYSSLESRVGAWIAEHLLGFDDNKTITALIEGGADMHAYTRDKGRIDRILLGGAEPTEESVTDYALRKGIDLNEMRKAADKGYGGDIVAWFMKEHARAAAKQVNFSTQYGAGVRSIRAQLGVSEGEARAILDGWRSAYPAIVKASTYYEALAMKTRKIGDKTANFVKFPELGFGTFTRRYDLYAAQKKTETGGIWSPMRNEAWKAFNHVVQGTSGLIMAYAALRVSKMFEDDILNLHASVHDSIIVSVHPDNLHIIRDIVAVMEDFDTVPRMAVGVDAAPAGMAWGHKREVKDLNKWIDSSGTVWS